MPNALILIIEDNEVHMRQHAELLEDEGYRVLRASTGEDGLRLALESRPDLIVMDYELSPDPAALNGVQVFERVRAEPAIARTPVVGVTAHSSFGAAKMRQAGFDKMFMKPLVHKDFLAEVASLLAETKGAG